MVTRPLRSLFPALVPVFALGGCRLPDPAPVAIDEIVQFGFSRYAADADDLNDRTLADAAENLTLWWDDNDQGEALFTAVDDTELRDEDLLTLAPPSSAADAGALFGVMVGRVTDCSLEDIDRLYFEDDQRSLFPDTYVGYTRTRTTDFDCFPRGDCEEITWRSDVVQETNVIGTVVTREFTINSGLRQVAAVPAEGTSEVVEARFSRTWMLDPAVLTPSIANSDFRQNYQLEIMTPYRDGLIHFYGMWTDLRADEPLNTESPVFVNGYIDGLAETLDVLEEHCRAG
jgi:hypothetical protein